MKTTIFHRSIMFAAAAFAMTACNSDGDKFDYDKNLAYMSGTEVDPIRKFVVEDTPASENVSVSLVNPLDHDITVKVAIDPSKVDEYNRANQTSYFPIPAGAARLVNEQAVIPAGKSFSEALQVQMTSTENFEEGRTYLIPVTIVDAGGVAILDAQRTAFLKVARVLHFNALDISNPSMYSNFIFPDDKMVDMSGGFTYELKVWGLNYDQNGNGNPTRLCSFTSKNEANSSMLRFSENGKPARTLQWVCPGGNIVSTSTFDTERWYLLTFTFDGSNLIMYIDGNKDAEGSYSGTDPVQFQRIELGMSWGGGYPSSQRFSGRICEMRVWNRPLSPGEIKLGMCGIDAKSSGLVAYWKMNEGDGHVFHDATGNGYDMDWANTSRDTNENGNLEATPNAKNAISWTSDDNNKCAE
ncbi:DUF1735 and LamG domain-containing protein [uncultured Muribaculum sp.]|uniref:DUF1735 and LamG domain-containing protein n=1 Tax=uncultured Muribaculum sp. TaxID=1918613 RepID=UPI0025FADE5B|nr:DUF1735 and LamG domain-containing protein [uncultured Muribaculum sp.]